ncbi:MAG TPA: hypothetical protein VF631_09515 [Allosphingosinicella sp.]|jgi:hypothetical protein|uniref:hypothetical protein n=1 Tax=Allosphingosinicella sp. TaxID=2823234 RepID=UPI002F290255
MTLWQIACSAAAIYCLARAIADIRNRRYIWGALGVASAAVLMLTPIPTHAAKIDLVPAAD